MDNTLPTKFEIDDSRLELVGSHVHVISKLVKMHMKEHEDYGVIPGTKKPTLLKAGAEKIALLCNAGARYQWTERRLDGDHKEYEFLCEWFHRETGKIIGQGVGSCSTLETKYRNARHPADVYNTVFKIAKKRAFVDTAISTGACGDLFTQDVEDLPEELRGESKTIHVPQKNTQFAPKTAQDLTGEYEIRCDWKTGQKIKDDLKAAGYRWDSQSKVWRGNVVVPSAVPFTFQDGKKIVKDEELPPTPEFVEFESDEVPF